MGSDTGSMPQLDPKDFAETIVLTDTDVMKTREMRQLMDPDASDDDDQDGDS